MEALPTVVVPAELGGQWFAVPALEVKEILGERPCRPWAGAHSAVVGVVAWRRRAVGLVDLGRLLGRGDWVRSGERPRRLLIVQWESSLFAIPASAVREVRVVEEGQIRAAESPRRARDVRRELAPASPWSSATAEIGGVSMPILSLRAIAGAISGEAAEPGAREGDRRE